MLYNETDYSIKGVVKMHGFSIYLGQSIDKSYIRRMVDLGYTTIFTSVQIPEDNENTKYRYLGELLDYLSNDQLTYMIDINPSLLNQSFYQFLKQYQQAHFIIRVDHSTSIDIVNEIIENGFQCCLNASIVSEQLLQQLYTQLNDFSYICYCHNYYPRPDTGLTTDFVNAQNKLILKFNPNANIYGFIVGTTKRGPLYRGLPTLECSRYMHPLKSAQLLLDQSVNHIMVGDTQITQRYAHKLISLLTQRHFTLSITLKDLQVESILSKRHSVRIDNPANVLRSQEARHYCQSDIKPQFNHIRKTGAITIDNQLNGRYQGELQIIKTDLQPHEHINVVGQIIDDDIPLIDCLRPNDTFEFIIQTRS